MQMVALRAKHLRVVKAPLTGGDVSNLVTVATVTLYFTDGSRSCSRHVLFPVKIANACSSQVYFCYY